MLRHQVAQTQSRLGKVVCEDQNITQTIFRNRKTGQNICSDDVHRGTGNYLTKPALMSGRWTLCLCTYLTVPVPQLTRDTLKDLIWYLGVFGWSSVSGSSSVSSPMAGSETQCNICSNVRFICSVCPSDCGPEYNANYLP